VSQKVWSNILRPENATLVMVGNIDPVEAQEAAKTYFGSWAGWHPDPKNKVDMKLAYEAPTTPPNRQVILFDQENASQTDVTYLCQLPPLTQDNIAAAQVMGDTLSEGAWMALREQTGASYGAYAGVQGQPGGGPAFMYMSSTVQNDQSVLAVKSFLGLGEKAKDGKLDPDLVTFQKYHRAQSYGLNQQSTEQMLTRIMSVLENGFGLEWFKQYPKKLASVAMKDIPPLVSDRCVGHEVLTLVGPTVVLKPMFDAANMPVEVFDWKKAKLDYATKWNLKDVLKAEADKEKEKAKEKKK
jgi:predicted Zn-dependent peptidase